MRLRGGLKWIEWDCRWRRGASLFDSAFSLFCDCLSLAVVGDRPNVGDFRRGSAQAHAMARRYLAEGGVDPVLIGVEIGRLRDAADRLVRTDWARRRIGLMAHALLRYGSLTGGQISELF
jgi:hypothetical protein